MRLGLDLRCMTEGEAGGIAVYARELTSRLSALLGSENVAGVVTGMSVRVPEVSFPVKRLRVSNKLLNTSFITTRWPHLDSVVGADVFFAPTLKYLGLHRDTPLVLTLHDLSFIEHPEYFTFRQRIWHRGLHLRWLLERATRIIAVSQHTADDVQRLFPVTVGKVRVVYSGADHVPPGPHAPLPSLPPVYLLAFAPREARKNIANLRAAQAIVFPQHATPLVLIGSGAGEPAPGIVPVPYLNDSERWRAVANAQAFIYPSVYEGFGFPPLEAMTLGVPVIASHVTSIPEVGGDAALLVDPWDPQDIARAMVALVRDRALREQYSALGRIRAKYFTWDACAKQTAGVIKEAYDYAHRH
ncbi:MAG: glycosyltransferase family 1 protein [bacterium]|nr:glycosyltransferase family 1 protein [bacterium]